MASGSTLALREAVALAVHFEDVDVVGQQIEQRAGQSLGPEHTGPRQSHQGGNAALQSRRSLVGHTGAVQTEI